MKQFMLIFSLGPVQPFIAQARKTRDLWLGSFILSTLMAAGTRDIKGTFVFPTEREIEKNIPDIPNKYIALFDEPEDEPKNAQAAAKQSEGQIQKCWEDLCQKVWDKVIAGHSTTTAETEDIWKRQTKFSTLFETFWVIVEKTKPTYPEWLDEAESIFAARKRLRDFKAQDEPGEKSAISGEREILHGKGISSKEIDEFWKTIATSRSEMDIDQEGKEHLDAIDTVKRFAMEARPIIPGIPFPSTSSVATASFVERLLEVNIDSAVLEQWEKQTEKLAIKRPADAREVPFLQRKAKASRRWILQRDGDLYFPETFVPRQLEKNYRILGAEGEAVAREGWQALRKLLQKTDDAEITRPTPYYAILQMDGDNMGILLSNVTDDQQHERISAALSNFARKLAPPLVQDNYPGRLVYAGGDDVLALAPLARDIPKEGGEKDPLRHILDLAEKLQDEYCKRVKKALPEDRQSGVTASMGIVFVHHYTSLSYVLRSAREAESSAKRRYGRNALVVTVLRRSGEQTRVGCHWQYEGLADEGQPIRLFSTFYRLFKDDILSPKCVHILLEEAPTLIGLSTDAQESEIRRVLLRQYDKARGAQNTDETKIRLLADHLAHLAKAMDDDVRKRLGIDPEKKLELDVELHADATRYGIVETLGWLLVMAFLARKEQE